MRPFTARPLHNLFLFFCFSLVFSVPSSSADTTLNDAIVQFAERVAAIPNLHGPVNLQFLQDPAFQSETGKDWQETLRKEIENRRITVTEDPSATLLRIGVAETPTQLILSAAVRIADKDEVRFLAIPRGSFRATSLPVAPVRIERQLVYQTPDRILDVSSLWNGAEGGMAIFVSRKFDLFVLRIDSTGQTTQTIPLASSAQPTRDPRGELSVRASEVSIVLSGKSCDLSWSLNAPANCHASKNIWRNPPVLTPSCDAGGWKLLSDGPDWSTTDSLQVIPASANRHGSATLLSDFPGPILSINGEQDPAGALVVTKNLLTGNYEVYKITLVCGN